MQVTLVGTGDAFGSGGRLNTCFQVEAASTTFLIDCGSSALIGLKRLNIPPNNIDAIFITHFHADHFGGVPFFVLDAQLVSKRIRPLTIVGPVGVERRLAAVMESSFPGSSNARRNFAIHFVEAPIGLTVEIAGVHLLALPVRHGQPDGSSLAYRFEVDGRSLSYTGDTEWVEELVPIGRETDLFIAEAYSYEKKIPYHLDLQTLEENLGRIQPKRLVLTHIGEDMLRRIRSLNFDFASDGDVIRL